MCLTNKILLNRYSYVSVFSRYSHISAVLEVLNIIVGEKRSRTKHVLLFPVSGMAD